MPVLTNARESARQAKCQSNLRQIGNAFTMYLSDWSNLYPNTDNRYLWQGRGWRLPLSRYVAITAKVDPSNASRSVGTTGGVLVCPSDAAAKTYNYTSYAYSAAFYHTPDQINGMTKSQLYVAADPGPECVSQPASQVNFSSKKVLLGEWTSNHWTDKVTWWDWRGARNYLFVDGHVKYLRATQIRPAKDGLPDPNLTVDGISGRDF